MQAQCFIAHLIISKTEPDNCLCLVTVQCRTCTLCPPLLYVSSSSVLCVADTVAPLRVISFSPSAAICWRWLGRIPSLLLLLWLPSTSVPTIPHLLRYLRSIPSCVGCRTRASTTSSSTLSGNNAFQLLPSWSSACSNTASKHTKEDETSDGAGQGDHQRFVVVNPRFDLASHTATAAHAILTTAASTARRTIQKVLLHTVAYVGAKIRAGAAQAASLAVASIRVVVARIATHESLALEITASTLPTRTLEPVSARLSVRGGLISRTRTVGARACFGWIALPSARSTDGSGVCKLARAGTTSFIAWITDRTSVEFASFGIAAGVAGTAIGTTAVTVLAFFDDPVAALVATNGNNAFVIGETARLHRVAAQCTANVTDRTGGEGADSGGGVWIHHVLCSRITGGAGQRAALARVDNVRLATGAGITVMNGTKSVSTLMCKDLPLG